jgi:hypothetical protein
MNRARPVVLVLIAIAAAGGCGTIRNLIRSAGDREEAGATAGAAEVVLHDATLGEVLWTRKVGSLREMVQELEQQVSHTTPDLSAIALAMRAAADELDLDVLRLHSDPTGGIVSISVVGAESAAYQWLQGVELAMRRDGALLENLMVTAEPQDRLAMEIEVRYRGGTASRLSPTGLSMTQMATASQTWPNATPQAVTAAFTAPASGAAPLADLPAAEAPPSRGAPPAEGRRLAGPTT